MFKKFVLSAALSAALTFGMAVAPPEAKATTTISISIDIPDADSPDVISAMREVYATNGNPNPSQAQIVAAMKADLIARIKAYVLAWRRAQAASGVVAPVAN